MKSEDEDPIVDEVRAARQRLWEQAGCDLDRLVAMLQKMEKRETRPFVRFPPRRLPVAKPE